MKNKKGLSALLLTGALLMSANTAVFAANVPMVGNGDEAHPATASITKEFEFAEGITTPAATFSFAADAITADAPQATIMDIDYSDRDNGNLAAGKYTISKNSEIHFGTFPHAGMYEYDVRENMGAMDGVTYSTEQYRLRIYVANKADGTTYIKSITASDGKTKRDDVLFTNTYVKNGGNDNGRNEALKIEKQTTGDFADKTKKFSFKLTLTKAATTNDTKATGKIGNQNIEFEYGVEKTFQLSDKETLVFENLPAGTRYVVTEVGAKDGYVPTVTVVENGVANQAVQGTDEDDLRSAAAGNSNLVGERENRVTFVNDFADHNIPITGIIENNLPFILLIGVGIAAFGSLAVMKKRRTVER